MVCLSRQDDLAGVMIAIGPRLQHLEVDLTTMKPFDGHCHMVIVRQQLATDRRHFGGPDFRKPAEFMGSRIEQPDQLIKFNVSGIG